jgi:hypothetical protein
MDGCVEPCHDRMVLIQETYVIAGLDPAIHAAPPNFDLGEPSVMTKGR